MDFETIFNNLGNIDKKSINAYRSARQFKNIATYPLVRIDDKVAPVLVACIVNKLLSCELFLKSLIIMNTKEIPEGHHLIKLLEKSNVSSIVINIMSNFEFEKELEKINNVFVDWRYIYESDQSTIYNGFVNTFSEVLEEITREKILENYKLNMLQSFI